MSLIDLRLKTFWTISANFGHMAGLNQFADGFGPCLLGMQEAYELLKVATMRQRLAQRVWDSLSDSRYLGSSLAEWALKNPEQWRCLPADLQIEVRKTAAVYPWIDELQPFPDTHAAIPPVLRENSEGQPRGEKQAAPAANLVRVPWQHPVLCSALIEISGGDYGHLTKDSIGGES